MSHTPERLSQLIEGYYVYDAEKSETLDLLLASGYFDGVANNSTIIIYNNRIISGLTLTIDATGTASIAGSGDSNVLSVTDFGAVGDGFTDDTAAFQAAALSGQAVIVPFSDNPYLIANFMNFASNTQLIGINKPTIKLTSNPRAIRTNTVSNVLIENIIFDGNKDVVAAGNFATIQNSSYRIVIRDCHIINPKASYVIASSSTHCVVENCLITGGAAGAIELVDTDFNEIKYNTINDCVGFGVYVNGVSRYNLIEKNTTTDNGLELIGLTYLAENNRIIGNHAESTGDNGISISGNKNIVTNNCCINNNFNGIGVFGEENVIGDNVCLNNGQIQNGSVWAGIHIRSGFGNRGINNVVSNNCCGDTQITPTQTWGVRAVGSDYPAWASGATISGANPWRINGLNIYRAQNFGVTGSTAPVHTSGIVSDGTINWLYVGTLITDTSPRNNIFVGTTGNNNISGLEDGLQLNTFYSRGSISLRSSTGNSQSIFVGNGTPETVVIANPGAVYFRSDPPSFELAAYLKTSGFGNVGWRPIQTRNTGTTAARANPVSGQAGVQYYNTTTKQLDIYDGSAWYSSLGALPTYADDAAAGAGGLTAGQFYKTSLGAVMVKL